MVQTKTFKQIQAEVMELARKNDMDEADAMRLLRSRVKAAGLKMPKGTATDEEAKKQRNCAKKLNFLLFIKV